MKLPLHGIATYWKDQLLDLHAKINTLGPPTFLRYAYWAATVYKIQGITLSHAVIDIGFY